ncbi:hypothetical protein DFA_05125 [Cavenderia fasciculata]|uniref:Uncharacterized protein n=1 Tax=Cavenderia fasciculata TaxID=261658 RepID=F4PNE2_CACFS|nr:uncharacterized protein DFA_05125 [Cavenderia fasciculata]EGG22995.1 hypothetical protein DFA_05125 [Cavenderia fasciculata]|eukprot:XP_004360846.1 hypothetical protein DFA_05125 [Cavenderia fasciculata]
MNNYDAHIRDKYSDFLKALSTTIITLLDSFQKDKDILDHVIGFFNHTHQLGFKETNQLVQRILFSKQQQQQYQPDQINRFVNRLCVITDIVQQIIVTRGNITTDQILQIIDLIVQTLQLIHSNNDNREHLSEIGQLNLISVQDTCRRGLLYYFFN